MGKKFRGRNKGANARNWTNHQSRADYQEIEKSNKLLEAFYNGLEILPQEEQSIFWKSMRTELPNSFRFTGSKGHALAVQQRLIDDYIPQIQSVKFNGEFVEPPKQVEWFPEKLAWSMTTPKQVVRKFAPFSSFQKFLVSETSAGNISRQEIVSMIPPLLMNITPGMAVLDMCAAPGSKSAQLIEMLHAGEEARVRELVFHLEKHQHALSSSNDDDLSADISQLDDSAIWSKHGRSTGLLVANDSDYRRAQMLVHQIKRLNSPNLIVTNHDASIFPSIRIPGSPGSNTIRYLKFDRVLADVPCTGDGTARKNAGVWRDWLPASAMGLHNLQLRILVRALQMLKKGGRAIYSTCSLNPVENEAVVACAIQACGGLDNVRIVDCSDQLPGLKRRPGLTTWKLMDRHQRFFASWLEVKDAKSQPDLDHKEALSKFTPGMFAPLFEEGEERIQLDHCMRIYPYLQDTGGFFITVLEKVSEIKVKTVNLRKPETHDSLARPAVPHPKQQLDEAAGITLDHHQSHNLSDFQNHTSQKRKQTSEDGLDETAKRSKISDDDVSPATKVAFEEIQAGQILQSDPVDQSNIQEVNQESINEDASHNIEDSTNILSQKSVEQLVPKPSGPDFDQDVMTFKPKSNQPHDEPFKYLDPNHAALQLIYGFYQISPRFPRDCYMVRNATGEPVKAIYYTSNLVRDILVLNEGKGIKFVQAGVKMFMRQDAQGQNICRWRIQSEGLPIIESWLGEDRIVRLYHREPLRKLLLEMFIKVDGPTWSELGHVAQDIKAMSMGCCLLRIEPSDAADGFNQRIVLPLWRSIAAANVMLPKEERKAMLLRLFNDNSPLIDHSQSKARDAKLLNGASDRAEDEASNGVDGESGTGADDGGDRGESGRLEILPETGANVRAENRANIGAEVGADIHLENEADIQIENGTDTQLEIGANFQSENEAGDPAEA